MLVGGSQSDGLDSSDVLSRRGAGGVRNRHNRLTGRLGVRTRTRNNNGRLTNGSLLGTLSADSDSDSRTMLISGGDSLSLGRSREHTASLSIGTEGGGVGRSRPVSGSDGHRLTSSVRSARGGLGESHIGVLGDLRLGDWSSLGSVTHRTRGNSHSLALVVSGSDSDSLRSRVGLSS